MASPKPQGGPPVKKQKLPQPTEEEDEKMRKTYETLEQVQDEIEKLNQQASEEILQVESKYNGKKKPFYAKRSQSIKKIPGFWKKTLMNHSEFSEFLNEEDEKLLEYLDDIEIEDYDRGGFKISLKSKANPWFKNSNLTKEYQFPEGAEEPNATQTDVEWKEGKDLTKIDVEEGASFFGAWFSPDNTDTDVAEMLKDDIWTNPSRYYHANSLAEEDIEEGDEEGDEGED